MTHGGASGAGNLPWSRRELGAQPRVPRVAVSIPVWAQEEQGKQERKVQGRHSCRAHRSPQEVTGALREVTGALGEVPPLPIRAGQVLPG